jgi:hypothetical protein
LVHQGKLSYENVAESLSTAAKTMLDTLWGGGVADQAAVSLSDEQEREHMASLAAYITLIR